MDFITAMQLIYTRVESSYSPSRKSGFQTVYTSPGITPEMKQEIEVNIRVFDQENGVTRRQYFCLQTDQIAIVQSQAIPTDREISDSTGRPGVFLAHCLIISKQDFKIVENNPFYVFNNFSFVNNPVELVSNYNQIEMRELPVKIPTTRPQPGLSQEWLSQLAELSELNFQIINSSQTKEALVFGNQEDIVNFLNTQMILTHPTERLLLSFDTHAVKSSIDAKNLKWIGLPKRDQKYPLIVDASNHVLPNVAHSADNKIYYQWLTTLEKNPEQLFQLATFRELSHTYRTKIWPDAAYLSKEGCDLFIQMFPSSIHRGIYLTLSNFFSQKLSQSFADFYFENHYDTKYLISSALSQRIKFTSIRPELLDWFADTIQHADWDNKNKKEFDQMLGLIKDPVIDLWSALWRKDYKRARQLLEHLSDMEYRESLRLLFNPFSATHLLNPKYQMILNNILASNFQRINKDEVFDLVKECIQLELNSTLETIAPILANIDNQQLTLIENLVKKYKQDLPNFTNELNKRRNELGTPYRIWNYLLPNDK